MSGLWTKRRGCEATRPGPGPGPRPGLTLPEQHSRGQRQLLDVVDPNQLPDAEATEMLQRLDAAEPGHWVEELDRGRGQT